MRYKPKIISILILIVFLSGCQSYTTIHEDDINYPFINPIPKGTQAQINLFFPLKKVDVLAKEIRTVNLENRKLETVVIDELLKGTDNDEFRNVIPNGVKLLSINIQDSIAYVNFNKALINEKVEEVEEALIIYSIVNSLTSIEDIDKVQILIEGEKREKFYIYKLNEPIEFSHLVLDMPYNSPIIKVKEYYNALMERDYRKMFEMESTQYKNETRYNIFELYYETQNRGLVDYEITNYEIIKYDNETILRYEMNLYYSDGSIIKSDWMEINMKYNENQSLIIKIKNNK
ncbi:GerMN domain-containing protein [Proteiniborus sp.]|uniref:GerMN domain-containing protein n=1 Tax=Proteiniborus sp. TaxID=2079015 RepID=UPI00331C1603